MTKIPNEIYSYITSIQKVEFFNQQMVFDTKEGIYVYIPVPFSKDIYSYLEEIDFHLFYDPINSFQDSFQLFQIEKKKNKNRLFLLKELYLKSSQIHTFGEQDVFKIYQKCLHNFHRQYQFYFDVQNRIEEMYYPRSPFYHLLLHMSDIYQLLYMGEFFLKEWYELHPMSFREVLTLRDLHSTNFWGEKILNVSSARRDYFIYELANYYQMYYEEDFMMEELENFFHHFSAKPEDVCLFYALISYVEEFDWESFDSEEKIISYVSKTKDFLSEKYKEYQENKEKMLKEK